MIEFRLAEHSVPGHDALCEIWIDGAFKGALYAQPPNSVRLISGHLDLTAAGLTPYSTEVISVVSNPHGLVIIDVRFK